MAVTSTLNLAQSTKPGIFARFAVGLALGAAVFGAHAAPRMPASDAEVLETLPTRSLDRRFREVRLLRTQLNANRNDVALATRVAALYFGLALSEGDPRYVGYAQAALAPWWSVAEPPVEVLVWRATLRQYRHDFEGALEDLDKALAIDARQAQAWSQRAAILMVRARYDEARASCRKLQGIAPQGIAAICLYSVESLGADARAALSAALQVLPAATRLPVDQKLWIWTRVAEMAQRLDDAPRAEKLYREALAFGVDDAYLETAYADFLLDQGRAREVLPRLKDKVRSDPLLLRLVLAEKILGAPGYSEHKAALAARFDAARQRGDKLHLGEEARFALEVLGNAHVAVRIAQENWVDQREPRDARILLEAAAAAGDREAAEPAISWFRDNKIVAPRLQRLIAGLSG